MKIYSAKDKVDIKVQDVVVSISPLTFQQKGEIQVDLVEYEKNGSTKALIDGSFKAIKYAVKKIKGFKTVHDEDYELEFEDNGVLKDECVNDLLNTEISSELTTICIGLLNGIPTKIVNPVTGEPLEGIKILNPKKGKA